MAKKKVLDKEISTKKVANVKTTTKVKRSKASQRAFPYYRDGKYYASKSAYKNEKSGRRSSTKSKY